MLPWKWRLLPSGNTVMVDLFQRLFPGEELAWNRFHAQIQARLPGARRVLDLGCGDNLCLDRYRTDSCQIWGTDFHEHPNLQRREWFRLLRSEGGIPFPDDTFDVMTSCWVIEHIRSPRPFLREAARVLKPGGIFISLSINAAHYVTWAARLLHALPHSVTQELVRRLLRRQCHDTFPTWYRLNSTPALSSAAGSAGLKVSGLYPSATTEYFSFSPFLRQVAACADWFLEKIHPGLGRIFFVVEMSKPIVEGITLESNRSAA
jgi:SAM-dependent methyltransferase